VVTGPGYSFNSTMKIHAITFDAGGTLIEPWPSVGHVYAEVAEQYGVRVEAEELNRRFVAAWHVEREFDYSRDAWAGLVDEVFSGLSSELPSRTFFDELYGRFAEADTWRVFDDVRTVLEELKGSGMRLAVLSNWDDRLRLLLKRLKLSGLFEEIFISAEMGWTKPDGRIFQAASEMMGLAAGEILHVGDSRREDVDGALAAGWRACHLERENCSGGPQTPNGAQRVPLQGHSVTSLSEIMEIL
jgi:putative hydrolase of the HAD superfamily